MSLDIIDRSDNTELELFAIWPKSLTRDIKLIYARTFIKNYTTEDVDNLRRGVIRIEYVN